MMKWLKKLRFRRILYKRILLFSLILLLSLPFVANYTIGEKTKGKLYTTVQAIPKNKVGLLLGTSKTLKNGQPNLYFQYRVEAAASLYKAQKIDFILISGDNSKEDYDEPTDMKDALVACGVPPDRIFLDYAGFRTLDSVVRAKEIFSLTHMTIISQAFHNERAIYLAEKKGIKAIGFNAKDVEKYAGLKTRIREYFARVKVFWDLTFGVQPKFLGDKINIE